MSRVRPLGDRALIVDLPDLRSVIALHAALAARPRGVEDVVLAARTLAVLTEPRRIDLDRARTWVERALAGALVREPSTRQPSAAEPRGEAGSAPGPADGSVPEVVIDVVYDGEDLPALERSTGVAVDELIRRHTRAVWRVAFCGFAPGFGYLVTDDDWFQVPRRPSPRTRVPAGAVGLAGGFSGVYPREGPGGWQLIGRTDAPLWRPRAARPALLVPGAVVRFREVAALPDDAAVDIPAEHGDELAATVPAVTVPAVTVVRAGPQLLVEDLGRPGFASVGAGRSGALDRAALRLANRLVGNHETAAGVEALVGAELRFERGAWFAVTGARGALRLGERPIEPDSAVHAMPGDVLRMASAEHGLRYTVALRGGVDAPRELGSCSTDIGASIGPAPLADGDGIVLGDETAGEIPPVDVLTVWSPPDDAVDVRVVPGPRQEWFARASLQAFYETEWEVTPDSNRVGLRLRSPEGTVMARSGDPGLPAELASEPMVPGAIQVPPSGLPTVLLADGPVTGGYPVIAVVADADLDLFAQVRPGQRIRFRHARSAHVLPA